MHRSQALVTAGAAALVLLLAGCNQSGNNTPDNQARTDQQLVPRTPAALPSDQGLQTPPLVPSAGPSSSMDTQAPEGDR